MVMAFETERGLVKAVNKVNLTLAAGEVMGLVGESGCGKSATLLNILRLVPHPGKVLSGEIFFQGEDLLKKSKKEMRDIRGKDIAMIFQDPMTTLNPVFRVGEQIRESMRIHGLFRDTRGGLFASRRKQAEKERALELMREVGIPSPEARYFNYPHEFSGGMQQRALIAIGLSCEPKLLLADEPTTALDVTIQAQILALMKKINREHGTGIILVTHDLGVAAEFCDQIAVMYAGKIVEQGRTDQVMENPRHPYTRGLLRSIPKISARREKIMPIPGNVPDLAELGEHCAFYSRCAHAKDRCLDGDVPLFAISDGQMARCLLYA